LWHIVLLFLCDTYSAKAKLTFFFYTINFMSSLTERSTAWHNEIVDYLYPIA
jgi:hypothetical protein